MTQQSSNRLATGVILSLFLVSTAVLLYLFRLPDKNIVQVLGSIGAVEAAVAGFVALLVLVVYTRETFLLRLTAEQQLESLAQPVVLIDVSAEERPLGEPVALRDLRLRNIGAAAQLSP